MLLKTITFDERNINWSNSEEGNLLFLKYMEMHINSILTNRGYVYLNQICEWLGDGWDPDYNNPCLRNNGFFKDGIFFEILPSDNGSLTVNIMCNV